ncbi:MAG: DEAD/DEAH box helicase, partial [Bdellovibrionales bacterium]|nr:DEAD/DEAH box helicase [Bdellovibrionales bacterium]
MKDPLSEVRRGLNSFVSSVIEVPPDGSVDADLSTRASEIKDLLSYADDNVSDWHEIIDLIDSLHADSKKSDPPVTQEIRPEIVQDFIENILKSVCGSDLDLSKLKITEGRTTGGALTLSISHQAIHTRYTPDPVETPVNFQYEIVFSQTNRLLAPSAPRLNAPNMLVVPASEWNTDDLRAIQNAFRRSLVADPLLHPRFNSKTRALSEYQVEAVDSLYEALQRKGRALGVMATAAGKTVVAWNVLDRILTEAKAAGRANGKVIFCVNNTVILEEAQQKLEEWFPGKYSISHMYGGKKDFSGDIIFATPDTLASEGQVAEILQASPISALVIDEVHHLPAVTYRQVFQKIEEKSREESWGTKFLGLTATETRPDRMSVIEFFDREIDYQYRTGDGRREGFLARTNYDLIDRDINPKDDIPIDEGSELYRQYREARYLPSRYPYLLNMYEVGVAESLDKRGLILCPGVKKAEELCNYFNNYGRTYAVVLTSEERGKDPGLFAAKYEAWKTGRWPEKYKNDEHGVPRRVPEVVMAVDIFREGTDVPGISYINLWADTNSSIRFLQSIGRGMRLSPFKTHIVIHDSVGLTRKLHLLHHLALLYVPSAQQRAG